MYIIPLFQLPDNSVVMQQELGDFSRWFEDDDEGNGPHDYEDDQSYEEPSASTSANSDTGVVSIIIPIPGPIKTIEPPADARA
jgi:hypothetical protein